MRAAGAILQTIQQGILQRAGPVGYYYKQSAYLFLDPRSWILVLGCFLDVFDPRSWRFCSRSWIRVFGRFLDVLVLGLGVLFLNILFLDPRCWTSFLTFLLLAFYPGRCGY